MVTLLLGEQTGDGSQAPFLVGLMKLRGGNAHVVETRAKVLERVLVSTGQGDVGGMVVGRATVLVGVFNGGVTRLNGLLRDGDIAARDGVQVGFGREVLHDSLTGCLSSFTARWLGPAVHCRTRYRAANPLFSIRRIYSTPKSRRRVQSCQVDRASAAPASTGTGRVPCSRAAGR